MQSQNIFKKLVSGSRTFDRRLLFPNKVKTTNYFDRDDWKKWLLVVKNFYRDSTRVEAMPMFVSKANDNRPYIKVKIFGEPYVALLDSGATNCLFGGKGIAILDKFKLRMEAVLRDEELKVSTADGKAHNVLGVVNVPLIVDGVSGLVRFLVVPSLNHSIILASDFCYNFGVSIDYSEQCWSVGRNTDAVKHKLRYHLKDCELHDCCAVNVIHGELKLTTDQQQQLGKMIAYFGTLSSGSLGRTDRIVHKIDTGEAEPIKQRHHIMSPYMLEHLYKELDKMLQLGVIRPSTSPWASPVLLVKKPDGSFRFCFDGRKLNSITKKCAYPLPIVDHILNKLSGAQYLSSIDLNSAFWQIPLEESSCEKTAFVVPGRGLFEFVVMPFGLCNAAQTQQRLMDSVLGPDLDPYVFVYLDDIIVSAPTFEKHLEILQIVFERLKAANLTININKCKFCLPSLKYLGFVVDEKGLRTNPEKVTAMLEYPRPQTATEIKRFLGMCSWYRRFVQDFSTVVAPLNALLKGKKKSNKILWDDKAEEAFRLIKQALVTAPVLASPNFAEPFFIQADASNVGLGAVLTQVIRDKECVVAYASRSLSAAERKYTVTEKELLAVIFAVEKFRCYIEGARFCVQTDHASLQWLNNLKNPTGRLARWAIKLSQFDMDIVHRKGALNVVPDALSRAPLEVGELHLQEENEEDSWYQKMIECVLQKPESYSEWMVTDGILYKYLPNYYGLRTNTSDWKIVVKKQDRHNVLKTAHDEPTAAHLGAYKTLRRLRELYYWPRMLHSVKQYISGCEVCAAQKSRNNNRPGFMGQPKKASFPWQYIAVDIMGPLPRTKSGHSYLLCVSDYFTKYVLLQPLRSATSLAINKFLEDQVFLVFGAPQVVIVDNGAQFISKSFRALVSSYGGKLWYNAKYHAQVNPVERINRVVGTAIRSYIKGNDHRSWDHNIQKIAFAICTAVHEVTGYSPTFLNFGRHVPVTGEYYGKIRFEEIEGIVDRNKYAEEMGKLQSLYDDVRQRLLQAYEKNARVYNLRKRPGEKFVVGDKVWKKNYVLSDAAQQFSAKLAPRYILCTVVKVISPLVYELSDETGRNIGRWHSKDLKPYHGSNDLSKD